MKEYRQVFQNIYFFFLRFLSCVVSHQIGHLLTKESSFGEETSIKGASLLNMLVYAICVVAAES